jgi:transposase InsO family protein
LFALSTNIRWEEMPPGFPPKMTVYDRFQVWRKEYNTFRPYRSRNLLTPAEFAHDWNQAEVSGK